MGRQPAALARYWKNHRRGGKKRKARTVTVVRRSSARHVKRRRRGGGSKSGGRLNFVNLALAGAGLALLTSSSSPVKFIPEQGAKLPGAKTFGTVAAVGVAAGAIDHFGLYRNKWLRYAGYIGIALATVKLGTDGTGFKWLGDDEYTGDLDDVEDVEGDDDMGDLDDVEDVEGDDD